jgi:hypothetical protein
MEHNKVSAAAIWASAFGSAFVDMWIQASDDADVTAAAVDLPALVHWAVQVADRAVAGLSAHADENGVELVP